MKLLQGGTLVEAVHFLQLHGVNKVSAAAVHPVLSGKAWIASERLTLKSWSSQIAFPYETNSRKYDKFKVLSVAPLLGEAIMRIHNGAHHQQAVSLRLEARCDSKRGLSQGLSRFRAVSL
jgi:phosphoribosylpyrophosphate synthetase